MILFLSSACPPKSSLAQTRESGATPGKLISFGIGLETLKIGCKNHRLGLVGSSPFQSDAPVNR